MYGSSVIVSKEAEANAPNQITNFRKIYFFTSILAFFLSYIFIALLKAVSFLDGSIASGGFFIGCVAGVFIPLCVHIVAVFRGEDKTLWKYGVEWEKLDKDKDEDEEFEDDNRRLHRSHV